MGKSPRFELGLCMFESYRLSYNIPILLWRISSGSLRVEPYNVTIRGVSSNLMQSVKYKKVIYIYIG